MTMLRCYRTRRRIGAYLDGALADGESVLVADHVAVCRRCHAELASLRGIVEILRGSTSVPAPEWSGLWEGIRHGIERSRLDVSIRARPGWRPRLVLATAAMCAIVAVVVLWQAPLLRPTPRADAAISVSSADTAHPRGTVMIYSPPEKDLAVVWVFDLD